MTEISNSRNVVTAKIDADGNVIVGDGSNISIINLKEAAQYKYIEADIQELSGEFEKTRTKAEKYPDDIDFKADMLRIDKKRSQKKKDLETLKKEVLKLADEFLRIPICTERLRLAKQHFENGEFKEARAVLDAEKMGEELDALLKQQVHLRRKIRENTQNLTDKANEYLILARLTSISFDLPDRFESAKQHFEQSLKAKCYGENVFAYAKFLQDHNELTQAQPIYEKALQIYEKLSKGNRERYKPELAKTLNALANLFSDTNQFSKAKPLYSKSLRIYKDLADDEPEKYLSEYAILMNNLAELHRSKNEFSKALPLYDEALKINRQLAIGNPYAHLLDIAGILRNLGELHSSRSDYDLAKPFLEESLSISRHFAENNPRAGMPFVARALNGLGNLHQSNNEPLVAQPFLVEALHVSRQLARETPQSYLPDVAFTLNNLASLYLTRNEIKRAIPLYKESLGIFRQLAKGNESTFLSEVAMSLNNLATALIDSDESIEALPSYEEALQIYHQLATENPDVYLPEVARTAFNLSSVYEECIPDKQKSLSYCREALSAALPFENQLGLAKEIIESAVEVAERWGEDMDAFMKTVKAKKSSIQRESTTVAEYEIY